MRERNLTRRLGLLLSGVVVASLLTACGGGTEAAPESQALVGAAPVTTPAAPPPTSASYAPEVPVAQTPEPLPAPAPAPVPAPLPRATVGSAALSWVPPTQNDDGSSLANLAGYRIYYGTDADAMDKVIEVSNPGLTSYTVGELANGTYYFSVTVYNTDGTESDRSVPVSKTI